MSLSKNDYVIQAFAPDTTKESFANRIHQGRLNRSTQYFHSSTLRYTVEFSPKLVVIIENDELGSLTKWCDIPKQLRCPFGGR